MKFDVEKLKGMVNDGWLRIQRHPDLPYLIWNYTEKTQYEKHWNKETMACRGLITDSAGEVIAKPFTKFFNWGEFPVGAGLMKKPVLVTEKMDRSLGIAYRTPSGPKIATRGSFTSEHAVWANAWMEEHKYFKAYLNMMLTETGVTPLFEIMCPRQNEHTVDYGGYEGMCYLGTNIWGGRPDDEDVLMRDGDGDYDAPPECISLRSTRWPTLESWVSRFETLDRLTLSGHSTEGYVAELEDGTLLKFKLGAYRKLSKIIYYLTEKSVWEALMGGTFDSLVEGVPDEFMGWVRVTAGKLSEAHKSKTMEVNEAFRLYEDDWKKDRKGTYEKMGSLGDDIRALTVMRLVGRGERVSEKIWRMIEPKTKPMN